MLEFELKIGGPFNWIGENTIFHPPQNELSGLYFHSLFINNVYVIEYIGITSRKYSKRFIEHTQEFLSGGYQIFDNIDAEKRNVLWHGRFGKQKEKDISKFFEKFDKLSPVILAQLNSYKIFTILIEDKRISERVEGAIYKILYNSSIAKVKKYIDQGIRYKSKRDNEDIIKIKLYPENIFLGLPNVFEV